MDTKKRVIIEITEEQAYTIQNACEVYARIRTGHFQALWSFLMDGYQKNGGLTDCPDHHTWNALCVLLQRLWFPNITEPGFSNWGVGHDKIADRAYTLQGYIRYSLGLVHNEYETPMNWLRDEPEPVIKCVE